MMCENDTDGFTSASVRVCVIGRVGSSQRGLGTTCLGGILWTAGMLGNAIFVRKERGI